MELGEIASKHDADLVGKDFMAFIVDDPASVTIAVETQSNVGAAFLYPCRHGVQHLHIFGIRIVTGKCVVELRIERDDIDAQAIQNTRSESAGCPVAAGHDRLDPACEWKSPDQVVDIDVGKILDEAICT